MSPADEQPASSPDPRKGPADHLRQYQWKKGQSGNPNGRPKGESITATLRRLLEQEHNGRTVQEILAEKVIREALSGKYNFAKELFDRVEGRPAQKIELAPQENVTIFVRPPRTFREGEPIPEGTRKVVRIDPDKL
jgi:hypothetical protein